MTDLDHPAAFGQERIWFLQRLDPQDRSYQFQATLTFDGSLDTRALKEALERIVARHAIFRTAFPAVDGLPVQRVFARTDIAFEVVDIPPGTGDEAEAFRRAVATALDVPFDVARLPLVRWTLIRIAHERHVLVHVEHHLVHDGWSFNIVLDELANAYRALAAGTDVALDPAPAFVDFARRQRLLAQTPAAAEQLAYWCRTLAGAPPALNLALDKPRPPVMTHGGDAVVAELPGSLVRALERLGRSRSATPFMTMFAAFAVLLGRYSRETDVCIGTGVAGRDEPGVERLVGMVVNTVVLRVDLTGDPSFVELLQRVRDVAFEAYANQQTPLERVVAALAPQRDLGSNPLFDVLFSFHDSRRPELDFGDVAVTLDQTPNNASAKLDLNVVCIPHENGMTVKWEYRSDLFERETMTRMFAHFEHLLARIVEEPERRISRFALMRESERRRVLAFGETSTSYPRDRGLDALFSDVAARTPDAPALVTERETLTYGQLERHANRLARTLRRRGVGVETPVAILLNRSCDAVLAMLAVVKAGGTYVPLDARFPRERIAWILGDASVALTVTDRERGGLLPAGARAVVLDECAAEVEAEPAEPLGDRSAANSLAYVMYTSGSTGVPKGVCITQRGIVRLATGGGALQLRPDDVVLQYASYAFDASTYEIWAALLAGAALAIAPPEMLSLGELGAVLARFGVSALFLTAPLFHQMVEHRLDDLRSLRLLIAGGDVVSPQLAARFVERVPACRLLNGYGPTENTTFTTTYEIPASVAGRASTPIGGPAPATSVYVLDPHGSPTAVDVPGEIWTGGDGLARGYLGRPELTAERFVPDPFSEEPAARLYRTGDFGRWRSDGVLEFLGRTDDQVKVRGFRIELGEVEAALLRHPSVREAAVSIVTAPGREPVLAAFVVLHEGATIDEREIRRFVGTSLPDYAVPSLATVLDALPASVGGKVDRKTLAARDAAPSQGRDRTLQGPVEERLAGIWQHVLALPGVSRDDDFFELGGHSLAAMRALARINETFDVELALRELFERRTLAELAEAIARAPRVVATAAPDVASLSDAEIDALLKGEFADVVAE